MSKTMTTGRDVVWFLTEQHRELKALFQDVRRTDGDARVRAFQALRRMLAVHETAEEEIVHPAARRGLANGDIIVALRLAEERAVKEMLAELEALDPDSDAFDRTFSAFEAAVMAHAHAEETTEFDLLADELDPTRLERMQRAAAVAASIAPTQPHSSIGANPANLLVGPFASMVDKARDALQGDK